MLLPGPGSWDVLKDHCLKLPFTECSLPLIIAKACAYIVLASQNRRVGEMQNCRFPQAIIGEEKVKVMESWPWKHQQLRDSAILLPFCDSATLQFCSSALLRCRNACIWKSQCRHMVFTHLLLCFTTGPIAQAAQYFSWFVF